MRLLLDTRNRDVSGIPEPALDDEALAALYAFPTGRCVRANFVSTLDGSAVGPDGVTGSINTPADNRVFALQRLLCDVVLVGAGTARAEAYRPVEATPSRPEPPPLVVVSASATPPSGLLAPPAGAGRGVLLTCEAAGEVAIAAARDALGEARVWVVGERVVDLPAAVDRLAAEGMPHVLAEGGPTLFATLLGAGLIDELALTHVPVIVGGSGTRVTNGVPLDIDLTPLHLLEEHGTVLGLWRVVR